MQARLSNSLKNMPGFDHTEETLISLNASAYLMHFLLVRTLWLVICEGEAMTVVAYDVGFLKWRNSNVLTRNPNFAVYGCLSFLYKKLNFFTFASSDLLLAQMQPLCLRPRPQHLLLPCLSLVLLLLHPLLHLTPPSFVLGQPISSLVPSDCLTSFWEGGPTAIVIEPLENVRESCGLIQPLHHSITTCPLHHHLPQV